MSAPSENLGKLQHPRFARFYTWLSERMDAAGVAEHRKELLAPLRGEVIEVGAGNGRNFAHYPSGVTAVVAVEPDDTLRETASREASAASVPIEVVRGRAERLPAADDTFDAAVVSLVLCSIGTPADALAEVRRVLKPGGTLRFLEHVRSANRLLGAGQTALVPVWTRLFGGCHLNRDTASAIERAGFELTDIERFGFNGTSHILGTARAA